MEQSSNRLPIWVWGLLLGLVLILASTGGRLRLSNPALSQHFALQPTPEAPAFDLPDLSIGGLPAGLQERARALLSTLGAGGAGRPIEPSARSARLEVEVSELRQAADGLHVVGEVTNISTGRLVVPISAFELRDSTGASYIAGGGGSAELGPGESTTLDLLVPLPPDRGLLLITSLPPDPPVQQRLILSRE